jgi:hypothetical protein
VAKGKFSALQQRILIWMVVLGSAGITWFALQEGMRGLAGFLTGAAASSLSFWLLHRLTGNIEAASTGQRVSGFRVLLLSLRFLVVGAGLYGILRTYEVSRSGVAAGLLLTVAAVTLANLYDWFRS